MTQALDMIAYSRNGFLKLLDGLSVEQMNKVPAGFNNNLAWNLGHIIAVQQQICYLKSGVAPVTEQELIDTYQKGSKPGQVLDGDSIQWLKEEAANTLEQLNKDVAAGAFKNYPEFKITEQQIPIKNIDDALNFVAFHEGLHWGYAQALKRAVTE